MAVAGVALGVALGTSTPDGDPFSPDDYRQLYPSADEAEAAEINAMLNIAMDVVEEVEPSARSAQIEWLSTLPTDDAYTEQVRRWTLAAIGYVLTNADLSESDRGLLASSFLDVAHERGAESSPGLKIAARARMIETGLIQYSEFSDAVAAVDADEEVILFLAERGLD